MDVKIETFLVPVTGVQRAESISVEVLFAGYSFVDSALIVQSNVVIVENIVSCVNVLFLTVTYWLDRVNIWLMLKYAKIYVILGV